jgi:hypothetical protein
MLAKSGTAIVIFLVMLNLGFATAAVLPKRDGEGLFKVSVSSPKPNDVVGDSFKVTYTSRTPTGEIRSSLDAKMYLGLG